MHEMLMSTVVCWSQSEEVTIEIVYKWFNPVCELLTNE